MKASKYQEKIMITGPLSVGGGVYKVVDSLLPFLPDWSIALKRGSLKSDSIFRRVLRSICLPSKSLIMLIKNRANLILINTSLSVECMMRDGMIIWLAKFTSTKPILIIHGFDDAALNHRWLLKMSYFKASSIFVSSRSFADALYKLGYKGKITTQFNPVDIKLLDKMKNKALTPELNSMVFIGRFEVEKGVLIVLEIYRLYKTIVPSAKLSLMGTGKALPQVREFIKEHGLCDVDLYDKFNQDIKEKLLKKADLFIFPTIHKEGLPISVLEAMAAGVVIVTRPIAGLVDLYDGIQFGELTTSIDPNEYLKIINRLAESGHVEQIKQANRRFAQDHFHPRKILENIIDNS